MALPAGAGVGDGSGAGAGAGAAAGAETGAAAETGAVSSGTGVTGGAGGTNRPRRRTPHHRRASAALLLAAATAAASGCAFGGDYGGGLAYGDPGERAASATPIPIGLLLDTSGTDGTAGTDARDGFQLYVSQHGGRLGGRPAGLTISNEGPTPSATATTMQTMLAHGVQAVVGPIDYAGYESVAPLADAAHVPLVGVVARPDLTDISYVWNVAFLSTEPGAAIAPFIYNHVKSPVFAIGGNYPGDWEQVRGFTDSYSALGGKLANTGGQATFTPATSFSPSGETTDFSPYLQAIKESGAKAVYCAFTGDEAVRFVQQYARSAVKDIPLYAVGLVTDGPLLKLEGAAATDITSVLDYSPDVDTAANRTFVSAWAAGHDGQEPSVYALTGYDAAALLDQAIGQAGPKAGAEAINAAIGALGRIDSPRGAWQLASTTHAPIQKWYLRRVQVDGTALANVEIEELATLPD
ncbi:branched-chain amino acid transport system substrate-binding protein [Catenulispora sp. MAP12-49]|uniref:ABC transporter substrate-binding protein n=1 Tax=Catenulispora sp. MAP12-49 TaxID=3156302 RepID=UPI003518FB0F